MVNTSPTDLRGDSLSGHDDPDIYLVLEESRHVVAMTTDNSHVTLTKEHLSWRWGIGIEKAAQTLRLQPRLEYRT